tara:strand:- start:126 stop:269 length:144 start_codon:yes stop_codon:yes gene_type:complete
MASKIEHIAETNIVNTKAKKNNVIILWVGIKEIQQFHHSKKSAFKQD